MPQPTTRAVDRALDILLCFSQAEPTLTLTQICERVGMHKSTVHRLLATLEHKRFIERVGGNGAYQLGLGLIELGFSALKNNDVHHRAEPYMLHLASEYRENVDFAILDGNDVIYLQVIESPQRVKIAAAPGQRLPAFCTATGKVIMAFLPEERAQEILAQGMHKYTPHTQTSISEIRKELVLIRERGFATSEQEYEEGINAVAAPILDANQYSLAAIAIAGPVFRLGPERLVELGPSLKATTDSIAHEIGAGIRL